MLFGFFKKKKTEETAKYAVHIYDKVEKNSTSIMRATKEEALDFLKRKAEASSEEISVLERGVEAFDRIKVTILRTGKMVELAKISKK